MMAASMYWRIVQAYNKIQNICVSLFSRQFPPEGLCLATTGYYDTRKSSPQPPFSLEKLLGDGILWAVPKHRRSLEIRWQRKFGHPKYVYKLLLPKTNLLVCNSCGDHHAAGLLCPNCYKKVREETELMQEAIQTELGLSPVEEEVVVLFKGEKQEQPNEFWKGKRVVEVAKPRPAWFSKNLLQQSTEAPSSSSEVKPSELA